MHLPEEKRTFKCNLCKKAYFYESRLKAHKNRSHPNREQLTLGKTTSGKEGKNN